jgi:response regulator RpfG family c-di-GMP phosphodiesterase
MMKNVNILLLATIVVAFFGAVAFSLKDDDVKLLETSILPSQDNKSPLITSKANNPPKDKTNALETTELQQATSSNLGNLETELNTYLQELEKVISTTVAIEEGEANQIIEKSDKLIAQINKQYGIDTQNILALNDPEKASNIPMPEHNESFKQLEEDQRMITQDIQLLNNTLK